MAARQLVRLCALRFEDAASLANGEPAVNFPELLAQVLIGDVILFVACHRDQLQQIADVVKATLG